MFFRANIQTHGLNVAFNRLDIQNHKPFGPIGAQFLEGIVRPTVGLGKGNKVWQVGLANALDKTETAGTGKLSVDRARIDKGAKQITLQIFAADHQDRAAGRGQAILIEIDTASHLLDGVQGNAIQGLDYELFIAFVYFINR